MDVQEKATRALQIVRNESLIAFDVETNGLDWKTNVPIGYVITSPDESLYVPIRHTGGGNLVGPEPLPDCPHAFEADLAVAFTYRSNKKTVGHNLKFDLHFAANAGIHLGRCLSCTQNNESLLDEYSKSYSLDFVAKKHGVTPKLAQEMYDHISITAGVPNTKNSMGHFHELSGTDKMVVDYAEGDGITTLELYRKQMDEMVNQNLMDVLKVEEDLISVLFRMERRGLAVDVDRAEELKIYMLGKVRTLITRLPDGFNVRSPKDMKEYVSQYRTDWPLTDKGNPSFVEEWLLTFPEGKIIVDIRKSTNMVNTFITPLLERHTHLGRVHPNFTQNKRDEGGTISGRLACSSPNMQQVPKHDKSLAPLFRQIFTADNEDYRLSGKDYSQCEPRLFGHYSKDMNLVEGYSQNPSKDVHQIVAEMFDLPRETRAKRMNMGMFTGMYPRTFALHMGISVEEATLLRNKWLGLFPGVKTFQDAAKDRILMRGFVRTLLGRRERLEDRRFAYRAVSKIIQGGNADILKYKMVEVDKLLENTDSNLVLTTHDDFLFHHPNNKEGDEAMKEATRVCEDVQSPPFNLRVPFKMDSKTGRTWADASF